MPPKRGRGKATTSRSKSKSPALEDIDQATFDVEYEKYHNVSSNAYELKFMQTSGETQPMLKKMNEIQKRQLDSGFISKCIDDSEVRNAVEQNLNGLYDRSIFKELPDIKFSQINSSDFDSMINLSNSVNFQFNNEENSILKPHNLKHYPLNESNLRSGFVFNLGGLPLTIEWCPVLLDGNRYLFAVVVEKGADIDEFANSKCCLMVLRISPKNEFQIVKQILVEHLIKELEFPKVSDVQNTMLKLTLSNGSVEIWKIDAQFLNDSNTTCKIESGSTVFKLPNDLLIITSSFASTDSFVFGTNLGLIGQYSITSKKLHYLIPLKSNSITSLRCMMSISEFDEGLIVLISSTDSNSYFVKLPLPGDKNMTIMNNLFITEIPINFKEYRFNRTEFHSNTLKSFFNIEYPSTIKQLNISDPMECTFSYKIDESIINTFSCQTSSNDGIVMDGFMLITGHSSGSVRLSNVFDLGAQFKEKKTETLKILEMKLIPDSDSKFYLDLCYTTALEPDNQMELKQAALGRARNVGSIYDNDICTLKVSMMDEKLACIWGNGLLVVEDLLI